MSVRPKSSSSKLARVPRGFMSLMGHSERLSSLSLVKLLIELISLTGVWDRFSISRFVRFFRARYYLHLILQDRVFQELSYL